MGKFEWLLWNTLGIVVGMTVISSADSWKYRTAPLRNEAISYEEGTHTMSNSEVVELRVNAEKIGDIALRELCIRVEFPELRNEKPSEMPTVDPRECEDLRQRTGMVTRQNGEPKAPATKNLKTEKTKAVR